MKQVVSNLAQSQHSVTDHHHQQPSVMKQVVSNLAQSQHSATDHTDHHRVQSQLSRSSSSSAKRLSSRAVKTKSDCKPSVTFEQAERDENIYRPRPTQFVRCLVLWFTDDLITSRMTD